MRPTRELIVIVGMPGSGKTTYAKKLVEEGLIDNYCDDYEFWPLKTDGKVWRDEDRRLIAGLNKGQAWAVADTRYCDSLERRKLKLALKKLVPNLKISYVYFDNRPDSCELNATRRKGGLPRHEINLIYYYTKLYKIPPGAKIIKIKTDW